MWAELVEARELLELGAELVEARELLVLGAELVEAHPSAGATGRSTMSSARRQRA
jgi:hypothetical protein